MSCLAIVDDLLSYELGELSSERHGEIERHIAQCPQCAHVASGLQALPGMIRTAFERADAANGATASGGVAAEILTRIAGSVDDQVRELLQRQLDSSEQAALDEPTEKIERKKA